jgi:hypothetical protein
MYTPSTSLKRSFSMIQTGWRAVQAWPWSLTHRRQRGQVPSMKRLSISMPADLTIDRGGAGLIERPPMPTPEERE